jgi:prevent-host-death family protein
MKARKITQRELRNDSGEIMRALDAGTDFVVTRNGVPVAELTPLRHRRFIPVAALLNAFQGSPVIDAEQFRRDVDELLDQDPTPRG